MDVLVPIDGSKCSTRALDHGIEFTQRFDATLDVVHIAREANEFTDSVLGEAQRKLEAEGLSTEPELVAEKDWSELRYGNQIGKDILTLVERRGYDHVIMGHHGSGAVGRLVLGSAAETVIRAVKVRATIVP